MKRRDLFKMAGTLVAGVVAAPLANMLPEQATIRIPVRQNRAPFPFMRIPESELRLSPEEFTAKYIEPTFEYLRAEHAKDLAFLEGESWQS